MIFDRLLIREKLNLLVLVPLLVILALSVPLVAQPISGARLSGDTARAVSTADGVASLVERLQSARLQAVAYLTARTVPLNTFLVESAGLRSEAARLREGLGRGDAPGLPRALDETDKLQQRLSAQVPARSIAPERVVAAVGQVVIALVDAVDLTEALTVSSQDARQLAALDALLRANEAASRSGALLLLASRGGREQGRVLAAAAAAAARDEFETSRFGQLASADSRELLQVARAGLAARQVSDLLTQLPQLVPAPPRASTPRAAGGTSTGATAGPKAGSAARPTAAGPGRGTGGTADQVVTAVPVPAQALAAVTSQTSLRQIVGRKIIRDVSGAAFAAAAGARTVAVTVVAVALLLVGLVIWLSVVVGRAIARPLRRLTAAAGQVADIAQEELLRVADEDAPEDRVPRLAAVAVRTDDEVGELASAFNRVQATAALLLERQVTSRRNVAEMFAGVGQRTTNLVGRQLAIIDSLERTETDPDVLATLYRLDHVSTRLRRGASSLVVLSGARDAAGDEALSLADAVRAALSSIEEYQRVSLGRLPQVQVVPGAAADVVLMLAELVENGVLFSPPRTFVEVTGRLTDAGCLVEIVDHGLGMPPERLTEENARLRRRERLDLAPTSVLGLFVVGRLSRRHGIEVALEATPGGGVTARLVIPTTLLVDPARATAPVGRTSTRELVRPAADETGHETGHGEVEHALAAAVGRVVAPGPAAVVATVTEVHPAPSGHLVRRRPGERLAAIEGPQVEPAAGPRRDSGADPRVDSRGSMVRRVPGESLGELEAQQPAPVPEPGTAGDPEEARRLVDDVDAALRRAGRSPAVPPPLVRRVAGEALAALEPQAAPSPAAPPPTDPADPHLVDARAARSLVEDVEAAVQAAARATAGPADQEPADQEPATSQEDRS